MSRLAPGGLFVYEDMKKMYPTGLPLSFFDWRLEPDPTLGSRPHEDQLDQKIADIFLNDRKYQKCCEVYEKSPANIIRNIIDLPHQAIPWTKLTEPQLFKINHYSIIMNPISNKLSHDPTVMPVWKVSNSMWQVGFDSDYDQFVCHANTMLDFNPQLPPDFSITLDTAGYCNDRGYSVYNRTYLDGTHAYIIHYKGKPVYIISLSFMSEAVILEQLQAMNKKNNRWMFKFPEAPHLFFTKAILNHFPKVCMRQPQNLMKRFIGGYNTSVPLPAKQVQDRVLKLYSGIAETFGKEPIRDYYLSLVA